MNNIPRETTSLWCVTIGYLRRCHSFEKSQFYQFQYSKTFIHPHSMKLSIANSSYIYHYVYIFHAFISKTFISNPRVKLTKSQAKPNTLRLNFCYLRIIRIFHTGYHPKMIGYILKIKQKNICVCIYKVMGLIIIK